MRNLYRLSFVLIALLVFGVGRASADSLISYSFSGANSVSFELPVNPTPTSFVLGGDFQVTPINLMINGAASSDTAAALLAARPDDTRACSTSRG